MKIIASLLFISFMSFGLVGCGEEKSREEIREEAKKLSDAMAKRAREIEAYDASPAAAGDPFSEYNRQKKIEEDKKSGKWQKRQEWLKKNQEREEEYKKLYPKQGF